MPSHDLTPERGQTGSTIALKHTLPQGATCYSVACLLSAIQPNSNAIRKASRAPITGTRCRHCTHVLTRVVHSQTGSHAPTRIFPAAAQLQGVTLQVVQYLTLVTLARASFHPFATLRLLLLSSRSSTYAFAI